MNQEPEIIDIIPEDATTDREEAAAAAAAAESAAHGWQDAPVNAGHATSTSPFAQQAAQAGSASAGSAAADASAASFSGTPFDDAPKAKGGRMRTKGQPTLFKTFLAGFAGAAMACGITLILGSFFGVFGAADLGGDSGITISVDGENTELAPAVAQKALPSVAAINVYTDEISYGLWGRVSTGELTQSSLGSGVVVSSDGYVLTNAHVVSGAAALKVTVGGEEYDATVVGADESSDIAVVKLEGAKDLPAIEIGDSDGLIVGEWVMTIGSPFGLEQSVAAGIVSAKSRSQVVSDQSDGSTKIYTNLVQTDAAINPGNSGGALVDSEGKLVGINTLITSTSGSFSGVGFAIPVNYAMQLAEQLIKGETPTHAYMGVSLSTIDRSIAKRYGLKVNEGAYLSQVQRGSAAAKAGLEEGDIVVKCDGKKVTSASDLLIIIRSHNPGDTIKLTANRDGSEKEYSVTLGSSE